MGTWGTKLYENDLALDLKEEYIEKLKKGIENKEALEQIKQEYKEEIEDNDEETVFWMVLADTMWNLGKMTDEVKNKALQSIEKDLKKWKQESENSKDIVKREKELEKLKNKLNSEMPKEKKFRQQKPNKVKNKYIWNIGDIYAYQLKGEKAKKLGIYGRYLLFRKVGEGVYHQNSSIAWVYIQITDTDILPKSKEEIAKLEYVIISNEGNVKHEYIVELYRVTQKVYKEDLIYIGNFDNLPTPKDEYIDPIKDNISTQRWDYIETHFLDKIINLGTNKKPVYHEVDPRDEEDSHIRFLMRAVYYEEKLKITPPEGAIVKTDPLLYIALVDSMMIGGFVRDPVGIVNEKIKQEAYKRIEELRKIILNREDEQKEEKLKVLDELKEKIEKYEYQNPFQINWN